MQSPSSTRRIIARALLGFALAVPFAAANAATPLPLWSGGLTRAVAAGTGTTTALSPLPLSDSVLALLLQGPWRQYARNLMVPDDVGNLDLPPLPDKDQQQRRNALLPRFARQLFSGSSDRHFQFDMDHSRVTPSPLLPDSLNRLRLDDSPGLGLSRTLFQPTYSIQLDDRSVFGVSAVVAYQQFSTFGFGSFTLAGDAAPVRTVEDATGAGVRLGMASELAPGLSVGAAYQSQINMDSFYRYRGIYSQPGEFDIPASADLGLSLDTTGNSTLSLGLRHIQYSDVKPFTSSLLPNRFLSLLGDGTSPAFAWQDLTVYQVGWSWESQDQDLVWNVSWSSGRQPTPTSRALAQALSPEFASSHWELGVTKSTSDNARFSVAASYTPADYFLTLHGQGLEAQSTLDRVELEALWSMDF